MMGTHQLCGPHIMQSASEHIGDQQQLRGAGAVPGVGRDSFMEDHSRSICGLGGVTPAVIAAVWTSSSPSSPHDSLFRAFAGL